MSKINLGIIFGGKSSEHEVSEVSAQAMLSNISKEKYNIFTLGITKEGEWFLYSGEHSKIEKCQWEKSESNKKAYISPDSSVRGIVINEKDKITTVRLDAVIPVLHGKSGEDGTVQGLLSLAGIPFVGCDTCSSAACMDKAITNTMLSYNGISKAEFCWFYVYDFLKDIQGNSDKTEKKLKKYPMFVKPANAGSSVGISKVFGRDELITAIKKAGLEDCKVVVEECIEGKEVECAVLGNENPVASVIGEIIPSNEFYDYEAKYISGSSRTKIPAEIDESISKEIQKEALKAYGIMGCSGLSRVDFFVQKDTNKIFLNEINTFPGFTKISMYPKLIGETGLSFTGLIDKLISLAMDKSEK